MRSLLLLVLPTLAFAMSPSAAQELGKRREATALVDGIVKGTQNVLGATSRLHFLGEERYASKELAEQLDTPDVDTRRNIAQALAALASPIADGALAKLARDEDGAVRMSAVQGLGRIHSRRVGLLIVSLQDKTLGVRREAARALGALHARAAGAALIRAAKIEDEPEAREAMLVAVGQTGDRRQAKKLEAFLGSSSESTRLAATQGLCMLGDAKGFAVAKKLLDAKDKADRRAGVMLFEGASAKVAEKWLKPMLADPEPTVSAPAARILVEGGKRDLIEWLVIASDRSHGEAKFAFEDELERLQVTPAQREAILRRAANP